MNAFPTRRPSRSVAARACPAALALLLTALAGTAAASATRLLVEPAAGGFALQVEAPGGGRLTVHRTGEPVLAPRLVDAGHLLLATWQQSGPGGREDWVAIGRDGGSSWGEPRRARHAIALKAGSLVPGVTEPELPEGLRADGAGRVWLVQLHAAGEEAFRQSVRDAGAELLGYLDGEAHLARMSPEVAGAVAALPAVRWVGPFHPGYRLEPALVAALAAPGPRPEARLRYRLMTYTPGPAEKARLAAEVEAMGGKVVARIPDGYLIEALLDLDQLEAIARSSHLLWAQLWTAPEPDMDLARQASGADYIEGLRGYAGQGVRAEVMDGGVLASHVDLDAVMIHNPPAPADDHGTCTYGIVFGNGFRDGDGDARATGMMPLAEQGWFSAYGGLVNRYTHTAELVQPPIHAVFQSNSWGGGRTRVYDAVSAEMDDITWSYDFPIFQSQSNAGNQDSRPQAWAKNVISIGGVYHNDNLNPADDCWCAGGSTGPAEDGSIKPDLAHWYDAIYTTDNEPGYSPGFYTPGFGGTSGATPIVAGIGGLFHQMWADNVLGNNPAGTTVFEKRPHLATFKALLVNTAEAYDFQGTTHDLSRFNQGWGVPNARRFLDRAPLMEVIDESSVLANGQVDHWTFTVPAATPELRVTMVYTDRAAVPPAAVHRVNDVTLRVIAPDGTVYWGNHGLTDGPWSEPGGAPDVLNTVENVFVSAPRAGTWQVDVRADQVNMDVHQETPAIDQDYGLVVYPAPALARCSPPAAPAGLSAAPGGNNAVQLTWSAAPGATSYRVLRSLGGCAGPFTTVGTSATPGFTDQPVSGGVTWGYLVQAIGAGACSSADSACTTVTPTGPCLLEPDFAGLRGLGAVTGSACGIELDWPAAAARCGGSVVYNVYRSTSPVFTPGPANRVASCVAALGYTDLAGLAPGVTYHYVVRAEDQASTGSGPCGGVEDPNLVVASSVPLRLIGSADFETGMAGWTTLPGTPAATTGDFIAGDPVGTGAQPEDDHTPNGTQCLYTAANPGGAVGTDDVDGGEVAVRSPAYDLSGFASARLTLWRWHYNRDTGEDAGDYLAIDASGDGGASWANLETLDTTRSEPAWTPVSFDLAPAIPLTANVVFRIRSADGTAQGNIIESAIDDVAVVSSQCSPAGPGVPGVVVGGRAPLLAVKGPALPATTVRLYFGTDCGGTPHYALYGGDLDAGYLQSIAAVAGRCTVTTPTLDVANGPGSHFYVVAPTDDVEEGSLGTDRGARVPQPASACHPRAAPLAPCAP